MRGQHVLIIYLLAFREFIVNLEEYYGFFFFLLLFSIFLLLSLVLFYILVFQKFIIYYEECYDLDCVASCYCLKTSNTLLLLPCNKVGSICHYYKILRQGY